ncbi:hypothetical protein RJ640_001717 [Escallonia rubra]|uniref:Peptidase A1 domain-containing protein n=1 Tax=Escallonia rubra TaxID=112253 RepID=A0AA88QL83_9ASTE|nr:hypothetical protein RJ640_001717 [Escallonia rubra]
MEAIYIIKKEADMSTNPMTNFATRTRTASLLVHATFLPFLAVIVCSTIGSFTATKSHGLVTRLIHHDSVLSPFYNASASTADRATRAVESSIARLAYLKAASEGFPDDIRSAVVAADNGEPPIPQLLMMDTGSSLLWVRCYPCTFPCFSDKTIFDPSQSSTYIPLPCNSIYCIPSVGQCDSSANQCMFENNYVDTTYSRGNYATEKLTFVTSDEGIVEVRSIVFGCAQASHERHHQSNGILGLGSNIVSLPIQTGSMFSYCLGNISDPHYSYNQLILGKGARLHGDSTPLDVYNDLYYLSLEGISVGNKRLDIDPKTFERTQTGYGGVIIDSGSTWSFLVRRAFEPLRSEVKNLIGGKLKRHRFMDQPDWLCYKGIVTQDLVGFPVVILHFSGGADLELGIENIFHDRGEDRFCMAVDLADEKTPRGINLLGIAIQKYLNLGFDLSAGKLYFERIDCQLLED